MLQALPQQQVHAPEQSPEPSEEVAPAEGCVLPLPGMTPEGMFDSMFPLLEQSMDELGNSALVDSEEEASRPGMP